MKVPFRALLTVLLLLLAVRLSAAPLLSTTIDYLDYVFGDTKDGHDYYPLEVWEQRLKELADAGFRKVNLRVNCCGLTLYPTKVACRYGQDGRGHFEHSAGKARLTKTLDTYDALTETIRLGHKYGMEVWCWDSIWDDAAMYYSEDAFPEQVAQFGHFPLIDPWHLTHPGLWSRRDPRLDAVRDLPAADLEKAPIARIRVVSDIATGRPIRFTKENLKLYVSDDNLRYRPYEGPSVFKGGHTQDGHPFVELSGLEIRQHFVRLHHPDFPRDGDFAFVLDADMGKTSHIYDVNGNELPVIWGQATNRGKDENPPEAPANFVSLARFGWDWGSYQLCARVAAGPMDDPARWLVGVPEFLVPGAIAHKVDRFRELAAYPFDGYVVNIRSHSVPLASKPDDYGFNPEVRDEFLTRYGVDIYAHPFDREALNDMRSEGIDAYLRQCKALAKGRPLYMTATSPDRKVGQPPSTSDWVFRMGARWHFDQWFKDGSVDGVVMFEDFFPDKFAGKVSNGHPVRVIGFRDRANALRTDLAKFREDMAALVADPRLDEIELYEALEMDAPHRQIIHELLGK